VPKTLKQIPHVLVIQETNMQPGRDKLRGIFNYAHLYGPWHLRVIQGRVGEQKPTSTTDWKDYDGILVGQMMLGLENALTQTKKHMVLMDPLDDVLKPGSPFAKCSYTLDDSEAIGRAGAAFFIKRGYIHLAYVGESLNRNWSIRRGNGFVQQIVESSLHCHVFPASSTGRNGQGEEEQLRSWLKALPKPVALLAAMDTRALQVIDLAVEAGLRVPQDVAVLGIDNDELFCSGSNPTISSIQRDTVNCGFLAARMLDKLMRRQARKREVLRFGVKEIIIRESTQGGATISDPLAMRAREFIRINAGEHIGIHHITKHLNVSRRLLEMRFRTAYNRSLLDEIQSARLERVEKLLKETDLSLTEICDRSGYQTDVHLRRIFKKRFGSTMRDYRSDLRNR
jgi:LacI family transcriptional regulator